MLDWFLGAPGGPGEFRANPGAMARFDRRYHVFPASALGRTDIENGNKIVLPTSALDALARLNISYPMMFELSNPEQGGVSTHCGVLEFVADEGTVVLPFWMMQNLLVNEGDMLRVTNKALPKGTYVKIRPLTKDFLDLQNPRVVLENAFRNFASLSVGDVIPVQFGAQRYEIEILEAKPAKAISIIEADVVVDFAAPKDMPAPLPARMQQHPPVTATGGKKTGNEGVPQIVPGSTGERQFQGQGGSLPGSASSCNQAAAGSSMGVAVFSGEGRRLDGKPPKRALNEGLGAGPVLVHGSAGDTSNATEPWKNRIPGGIIRQPPYGFRSQ